MTRTANRKRAEANLYRALFREAAATIDEQAMRQLVADLGQAERVSAVVSRVCRRMRAMFLVEAEEPCELADLAAALMALDTHEYQDLARELVAAAGSGPIARIRAGPCQSRTWPSNALAGSVTRRSDQPLEPGYSAGLAVPGKRFRRNHDFDRTLGSAPFWLTAPPLCARIDEQPPLTKLVAALKGKHMMRPDMAAEGLCVFWHGLMVGPWKGGGRCRCR